MKLHQKILTRTGIADSCRRTAWNYWLDGEARPSVLITGSASVGDAAETRRAPRTQRQVNRDDTIEGANQLTTSWPGSIENLAEFDGYANVSLMRRARVVAGEYIKSYMKQQSEAA